MLLALTPGPWGALTLRPSVLVPLLAFLLPLLAVNFWLGAELHASLLVLSRWILLAALGAGLTAAAWEAGRRPIALAAACAGGGAAIVGLWQGLGGFARQAAELPLEEGPLRSAILARLGSGRLHGTFILPASLGGALGITLPLTLGLAATSRSRRARAWLIALCVPQAIALVWSFSLGAWFALLGAVALALGAAVAPAPKWRSALVGGFAIGLGVAAIGLLVRVYLLPRSGAGDRFFFYRLGNWNAAWRMFKDHLLIGTGLGTFGHVFPAYRTEGMNESRYAHCSWLQLLAELGIGALPLLALALVAAWRLARIGARGDGIGQAAAVAVLAFLLHNGVDFTAYQPSVGALFVAALVLAGVREDPTRGAPEAAGGERSPLHERVAGPGVGAGMRPIRIAALAVAVGAAGVLAASGLADLARERAAAAHGSDPVRERELLELAIRLDPLEPSSHGALAGVRAAAGGDASSLEAARVEAARAVALDPRTPFRHRDLAAIDIALGRPANAWIELARAGSLYPMKSEYREQLLALERILFGGMRAGETR